VKPLVFIISTLTVLALTLVSGIIQGRLTQRWGPTSMAIEAAKKLQSFPDAFGPWQVQSKNTFKDSVLTELRCIGYLSRTYENQETGTEVNVAVLLGPPGEISVHTPEICFSSKDFTRETKRQRLVFTNPDGSQEEFWSLDFRANDLHGRLLHVAYGWSLGSHWSAPEDPRFIFGGRPYLYKLQLAITGDVQPEMTGENPCRRFLADFIPAIRKYLSDPSHE
jgi:hypothetical protein